MGCSEADLRERQQRVDRVSSPAIFVDAAKVGPALLVDLDASRESTYLLPHSLDSAAREGMNMKIAVHRFHVWDSISDTMKASSRYATIDAIKNTAHGAPIPGTEVLIEASELNSDIEGMTAKDYKTPTP
jgi:hypothetical protein